MDEVNQQHELGQYMFSVVTLGGWKRNDVIQGQIERSYCVIHVGPAESQDSWKKIVKRKMGEFNVKLWGQSDEDKLRGEEIWVENHWNFENCVVYHQLIKKSRSEPTEERDMKFESWN